MLTRAIVDWIEGTTDSAPVGEKALIEVAANETGLGTAGWHPDKAFNRYSQCIRHLTGVRALCGRKDMGTHYVASGQAITALVNAGIAEADWIEELHANGLRASRFDLALDCINSKINLNRLMDDLLGGKADTRARTPYLITSGRGGLTLYVGAPQSNKHVRAYNKAAEVKNKGKAPKGIDDWIRIEIVMMREQARFASAAIRERGIDDTVRGAITSFVDFPGNPEYGAALAGETATLGRSARKTTDTRYWLIETVARVAAKQAIADPTFFMEFLERIQTEHESLLVDS